jgi:hypothetical protein
MLTQKELKEEMMVTFGRLRTSIHLKGNQRLIDLIEKFDKDLKNSKVQENYFDKEFWLDKQALAVNIN